MAVCLLDKCCNCRWRDCHKKQKNTQNLCAKFSGISFSHFIYINEVDILGFWLSTVDRLQQNVIPHKNRVWVCLIFVLYKSNLYPLLVADISKSASSNWRSKATHVGFIWCVSATLSPSCERCLALTQFSIVIKQTQINCITCVINSSHICF